MQLNETVGLKQILEGVGVYNFLVAEDHFFTLRVFHDEIKNLMSKPVSFTAVSGDWPFQQLTSDEEIREYDGHIVGEVCKKIKTADVLVTQVGPVNKKILDKAAKLKIIGCCRGDPVNINIEEATKRGIPVVNAPGRNTEAVAEFTVGLILGLMRNICRAHADLKKDKTWQGAFYSLGQAGLELRGKTAGIIGFGHIGSRVAEILRAFNMHVLIYDPYVGAEEVERKGANKVDQLEDLVGEADVITLHARYTPETHNLLREREFSLMKPTAYLVNTARGRLIDHKALYEALKSKRIAGAALDTFDIEPLPKNSRLYDLDNIIITPHIAGASKEVAYRGARTIAEDIYNYFKGKPLKNCVNPEVLVH